MVENAGELTSRWQLASPPKVRENAKELSKFSWVSLGRQRVSWRGGKVWGTEGHGCGRTVIWLCSSHMLWVSKCTMVCFPVIKIVSQMHMWCVLWSPGVGLNRTLAGMWLTLYIHINEHVVGQWDYYSLVIEYYVLRHLFAIIYCLKMFRASCRRKEYWISPKTCNSGRLHNHRKRPVYILQETGKPMCVYMCVCACILLLCECVCM